MLGSAFCSAGECALCSAGECILAVLGSAFSSAGECVLCSAGECILAVLGSAMQCWGVRRPKAHVLYSIYYHPLINCHSYIYIAIGGTNGAIYG